MCLSTLEGTKLSRHIIESGYYVMQQKMGSDEPMRDDVAQILESANRAAEITRNLLAFSRKQVINARPININASITKIEKLLSQLIGEDIEVCTVLAISDIICMADAGQLEQVLLNLATSHAIWGPSYYQHGTYRSR